MLAARHGDRRLAQRLDQGPVGLDPVQSGERGQSGGEALLVLQGMEAIPISVDQAGGHGEAVSQSREAVDAQQGLNVPGRDLQVLRLFGQDLRGQVENGLPLGNLPVFAVLVGGALGPPCGAAGVLQLEIDRGWRGILAKIDASGGSL